MSAAETSTYGGALRRVLALGAAAIAVAAFGLAHATNASAATTCTLDCPTIFGLAPASPGDITDTTATLTFFAIGASTPGSDYTWQFVYGLHGGALDHSQPGPDTIAAGSFVSHSATLTGLQPSTQYDVQVIATGPLGQEVDGPLQTFSTVDACSQGHCPAVTDAAVAAVGPNSATVFGTVSTGTFDTTWTISVWTGAQSPQVVGSGVVPGASGPTVVSAQALGLTGNSIYNWQLSATNVNGTASATGTFTTPDPCAQNLCADPRMPTVIDVTDSSAYVIGHVGTRGQPTAWTLQLSSDNGATWSPAATGSMPGDNTQATELDVTLNGLTQLTQYQVRIVADNGQGPVTGPATSFTTGNACAFGKCPTATIAPTLVKASRAVLGGAIDTKGSNTTWVVNWGTTTAYTGGTVTGDPLPGATGGTSTVDPVTIGGLLPLTTYHFQVVATNGYGTTTGGDQTFTTTGPFVNTDSIQWQYGPNLPKPWSGFTAADFDGTMYVTGNDLNGSIYAFDPYHGQDEFALQPGHAPFATMEEGSAFLNGRFWMMSVGLPVGVNNQPPQRTTEIYDPGTSTWTTGPVVVNEDTLSLIHPAFVNAGGTLYAFNGRGVPGPGRSHIYDEAWKLSADETKWLPITPPPTPVADPGVATGNDGRVFLFGGVACIRGGFDGVPWFADCLDGSVTNITQIYDPATDSWSLGAPMPTARYSLTAIHAGCALYAIGGLVQKPAEPNSPGNPTNDVAFGPSTSVVEVYDPVDNRWIPGPSLLQPRADFAAAFVGHQVWVLGGGPQTQLSSTEYVTPAVVASSVAAPAQPDGLHGWYVTHPTVSVDACNGIGGPATLIYGFDGSTTGHPYTGSPQTVTVPEGQHTFTYGAFDTQHNAATNVTRSFKVDTIAPVVSFAGFTSGAYKFTATDGGSGIDHVAFTATTPSGTVSLGSQTSGFSIPASSLPAGTTAITATAYDVAGNHSSVTQATGTATTITLTGATKGTYGHTVTLSATLKAGSSPLSGQTVVLKVGTQSCTATTNSAGSASCQVKLTQTPGSVALTATFAGTSKYLPASASGTFTIQKASSQIELTTSSCNAKSPAVSAKLVDDNGKPLGGRTVTFTVGSVTRTATTNSQGVATTGKLPLSPGKYKATASWPGDAYYTGDSDSGTVTISR